MPANHDFFQSRLICNLTGSATNVIKNRRRKSHEKSIGTLRPPRISLWGWLETLYAHMENNAMRRILLPILLLTSLSCALAAEVQWQPQDIQSAMQKAGAEGKLIYIFVEGDNCPPCDAFKASHLSDPAFVDFVNSLYVPIRVHMSDAGGVAFLESLKLMHAAVPRFYTLTADGRGVSMAIGMVTAPPMGGAEVLSMAAGRELPVDKAKAAELAGRIRSHAASQRASGAVNADNPLRYLGLAILEAQAWALAGRLDEAENAFGAPWAEQLVDQEIRNWYINFWLGWKRNLPGVLSAAQAFRSANPDDPAGALLLGRALAANGRFADAVREGETYTAAAPNDQRAAAEVNGWRQSAN